MKALIKKADELFSEYVRKKSANYSGEVRCITCGTREHWKYVDCGHWIKRVCKATRWDENNARPQCKGCNQGNGGELDKFEIVIRRELGDEIVDAMVVASNQTVKMMRYDYELLIESLKVKLAELN